MAGADKPSFRIQWHQPSDPTVSVVNMFSRLRPAEGLLVNPIQTAVHQRWRFRETECAQRNGAAARVSNLPGARICLR